MSIPGKSKRLEEFFLKDGRLRPIWRLIVYLIVLVIAYIVLSSMARTLLAAFGLSWTQLAEMITIAAIVLLSTWICRRFIDKRDMASLGFALSRGWPAEIGIGLLLGAGLIGAIFLVELPLGWIKIVGFAWTTQPFINFIIGLSVSAASMLAVAVAEETLIRGYMLQTLEESCGTLLAVLISSAFFGVLHLINPSAEGWADYVIPFTLTLAGIQDAKAYLVRRSLWLPIALHFAWNFFEYDILALTSASPETASFLATEVTGPAVWVGLPNSSFGPEVGILGVLAVLLGIGILWAIKRRSPKKSAA